MMLRKIYRILSNPKVFLLYLLRLRVFRLLPDRSYLRLKFRILQGKKLNIDQPLTFNEKLQWLKLNNRLPIYTKLVDKYEVREFIKSEIGEDYLIPLIDKYNRIEDIKWDKLPNQFVMKCTHGSGANIICKDKRSLNIKESEKLLKKWMKRNWFWYGREWPYKNVKPRIICEKYIQDGEEPIRDYRVFCFNGEPKFIAVDFEITNKKNTRRNLYDLNWNLLDYGISYPRELSVKVDKPKRLDEMIRLSKILAKDKPHVRIDFYCLDTKLYIGEITFYHQSGFGRIYPEEFDRQMGDWINLKNDN